MGNRTGLQGSLQVPGDKSISHRALLFSALAPQGNARLTGVLDGADVRSTQACLQRLGVRVTSSLDGTLLVSGQGAPWREPDDVLDCGNSGTTIRLMTGVLAAQGLYAVLTGDASIRKRPMARVIDPLRQRGAQIVGRQNNRLAPITILPVSPGALAPQQYTLPMPSAQVKSALLLAGLFAETETRVTEPIACRDHTERMLQAMGATLYQEGHTWVLPPRQIEALRPVDWAVPGDPSSAAFWVVAALLSPGADLTLSQVSLNPTRIGLVTALQQVGGQIDLQVDQAASAQCGEPVGALRVRHSHLKGDLTLEEVDIPALIDEIPILTVAGLYLDGTLTVRGADELRKKESDRLAAMQQELAKLGVNLTLQDDGFVMQGNPDRSLPQEPSALLDSWHDHRIAMALSILNGVAAQRQGPVSRWPIAHADCVNISYPTFYQHLERLI